jgi:hypothetical protein
LFCVPIAGFLFRPARGLGERSGGEQEPNGDYLD